MSVCVFAISTQARGGEKGNDREGGREGEEDEEDEEERKHLAWLKV